jgi:aminoglycoside phosphotransferase (APT) family kinase protein
MTSKLPAEKLQQLLAALFPDRANLRLTGQERLEGGVECDTFRLDLIFRLQQSWQQQSMVLRLFPDKMGMIKAGREENSLRWLNQAGFPVPRLFYAALDGQPLGKPFTLTEFIPGILLQARLLDDQAPDRADLVTAFCQLFVRLHSLDIPDGESGLTRHDILARLDALVPSSFKLGFEPALAWLRAQDIHRWDTAVTHNDFSPNNILLQPDGRLVVIDWTGFILFDPRADLSWTLFTLQLNGLGEWETAVFQQYCQFSPRPVDQIDYFKGLVAVRFLAYMARLADFQGPDAVAHPFLQTAIHNARQQFTAVSGINLPLLS